MRFGLQIFISFAISIHFVKSESCRLFGCGAIDHKYEIESNKTCVFVPTDSKVTVPAEPCGSKNYTYCPANNWDQPEDALTGQNYTCKKLDPPSPIGGTVDYVHSSIVPGDYCTNSTYCYSYEYGAKCVDGKCVSAKKLGESCIIDNFADEKKCPENSYCTFDTKICTSALKEGEDCSDPYKYCGFGTECIGNQDGSSFRCSKLFKAQNGAKFKYSQIKGNNEIISARSYCASYNSYSIDSSTMECRSLDKSNDTTEAKLRRDEPGSLCYYSTWNTDKADAQKPYVTADLSKCGFNTDNYSWCNKRKGDPYYNSIYAKLSSIDFSKYSCHVDSNWRSCKSFADENKDLLTALNGYFPLIANNDKCVKNAINQDYWGLDSAFDSKALSVIMIMLGLCLILW